MRNQTVICNKNSKNSEQFMQIALDLARTAQLKGEVPIGAVIVQDNKIIGRGYNQPISTCDPSAHAEIIAIRDAARNVQNYRLTNSTIYVTLQPCSMCMGAIAHARISNLVFAAFDPKKNQNYCNHKFTQEGGILEVAASRILIDFFTEKRSDKNNSNLKPEQPIGVFDSGVGGLNIVKVMQQYLPFEKIIYYGDTAHTPWGNQSSKTINKYSLNITKYLLEQNCKTIIIACNTASCVAYENIVKLCKPHNISVFNVAEPLLSHIKNNITINNPRLAIIGTTRTIQSKIYQNDLQIHWPKAVITALATPVLCPIIEEKMHLQNNIINNILKHYLDKPEFQNLDGLILACTHYHSLKQAINKYYKNKILLLEGSDFLAQSVKDYLEKNNLLNKINNKKFELSCFFSSQPKDPIEAYNYK